MQWMRLRASIGGIACAVAASGAIGCDQGRNTEAPSSMIIAASADPDALFPPAALNIEARQVTELIYEYLADVGAGMNTIGDSAFVKQLASDWKWARDSLSISFTLDSAARWHDGASVTSDDVVFSYDVYTDPRTGSMLLKPLSEIDSVTKPGSSEVIFWFGQRSPRQFFTAAAMMLILPRHLLGSIPRDSLRRIAATQEPVGSGRYRFVRWTQGSFLEVAAVPGHRRGAAQIDRLVWSIIPDYRSAVLQLRAGRIDVLANVRQETIPALAADGRFDIVVLPGMDYVFMQFNLMDSSGIRPHPILGSRAMRRALTMAVDRKAMVKSLFDTLAAVSIGPAVRAFPTTDTSVVQIPFDRELAGQILDSLGWRFPDGAREAGRRSVRRRGGTPLRFRLLVPVSSLSRRRLAVILQDQLRKTGVDLTVEEMDYSAFSARQSRRDFDAALASWHLGSSPEAVRATWTSEAAEAGGLNYGGYRNPRFDVMVDSALATRVPMAAREYFRRANQIIVDDAPAVWLYEPRSLLALSHRISPLPMRPNAWWLGIADWKVH